MQYVEVRDMTNSDLDRVMEIEKLCFKAPWDRDDIFREVNDNKLSVMSVVTVDDLVVGFCDYWNTFDSGTICQIAIHPDYQHQSLGSKLLEEVIRDAKAKKVRTLTLEVRESNTKAINFYKKYGFQIALVKESYYSNGENAIYMIKEVE